MEPELLAVTLFVSNVPASLAFYSALGVAFDADLHGGAGSAVIGLHPSSERWPTTRTALSLTVADIGAVTAALLHDLSAVAVVLGLPSGRVRE